MTVSGSFTSSKGQLRPPPCIGGSSRPSVTIAVTLPVCLHLDARVFHVPFKPGSDILLQTNNVDNHQPTYLGTAAGMEVGSDRFSLFRFTEVIVEIPITGPPSTTKRALEDIYRDDFFRVINRFIDSVRIVLNRPGLRNYFDYADFVAPMYTYSTSTQSDTMTCSWKMPEGGLVLERPDSSEEHHERLQCILKESVSLPDQLMVDAERERTKKNFVYALLNAVIALEIVVSDTVRVIGDAKGVTKNQLNKYIANVGVYSNIKATIKLLRPDNVRLPDDDIFNACASAITLRNKIMHDGKRNVSEAEVARSMNAILSMIGFLNQIKDSDL